MPSIRNIRLLPILAGLLAMMLLSGYDASSNGDSDGDPEAVLSGLALSAGTLSPSFSAAKTSYTAAVDYTDFTIVVTPKVSDADLAVTVDGTKVLPGAGSATIALVSGVPKEISVTVSFGSTTKTYTVTVTRALPAVTLSGLAPSVGTLSPAFGAGITNYSISVASSETGIAFTPTAAASGLTIKINGVAVPSGAASGEISLAEGSNTIAVTVSDGTATTTYTITVTRPAAPVLNMLSIYNINGGNSITTTPPFSSGTTIYSAVDYLPATIRVTPAASGGTIKVNGTIVASGNYVTIPYDLSGTYDIVIEVSDGSTTTTYTVTLDLIGS